MLPDEERIILEYLKANPEHFFSPSEIARKASTRHFRKDPRWAYPVLARMLYANLIEGDPAGHYRYIDHEVAEKERPERLRKRAQE